MSDSSHPMISNEEELLRYVLDNEPLSPETTEHIAQCSLCKMRISRYGQINGFLLKKLYRSSCPDPTLLNYYCANVLSVQDADLVTEHLQQCPLCAEEVQDIQLVLADFEPFLEGSA